MTPIPPSPPVAGTLPELPDKYEAAAHMFTGSLEEFKTGEKTDTAYSIPVGSPDEGTSVPLWTSDQMRAYALSALSAQEAEVGRLKADFALIAEVTATRPSLAAGALANIRDIANRHTAKANQGETK